jgi:hypothetical protein
VSVRQQCSSTAKQRLLLHQLHIEIAAVPFEKVPHSVCMGMGVHQNLIDPMPATQLKPDRQ